MYHNSISKQFILENAMKQYPLNTELKKSIMDYYPFFKTIHNDKSLMKIINELIYDIDKCLEKNDKSECRKKIKFKKDKLKKLFKEKHYVFSDDILDIFVEKLEEIEQEDEEEDDD